MRALASFVFALLSLAVAGCEASPRRITFESVSGQALADGTQPTTLGEGDLLLLDATPVDADDKPMNLCVTSSSSDPSVVDVKPVSGNCHRFLVSAKAGGA